MKAHKIPEEVIAQMRAWRAEGYTCPEIAEWTGFPTKAVYYRVRDIPPPNGKWVIGYPRIRHPEKIQALLDYGLSYRDIAERYGTSTDTLYATMSRHRRRKACSSNPSSAKSSEPSSRQRPEATRGQPRPT